jgi:Icc-related predicted phosphoesterase
MRVFALSDIHIDYEANAKWIANLSAVDYQQDVLILAGDVTDVLPLLGWCLNLLARRFHKVLFVPGNHDLWIIRDKRMKDSLEKFEEVAAVVESSGASSKRFSKNGVTIIPLFGWYDFSFGEPTEELKSVWMDFRACRWPREFCERDVAMHFATLNDKHVDVSDERIITFSHFLPRIDVMPHYISHSNRLLYPILGSTLLEGQLRSLKPQIHIYGHSHVNRNVDIDGVAYINNAFGYPGETRIAAKRLLCVYES